MCIVLCNLHSDKKHANLHAPPPSKSCTVLLVYFVLLQRTAKRLRLSKVKVAKYYDSGSLMAFYLVSLVWGINYIIKVGYQCYTISVVCS